MSTGKKREFSQFAPRQGKKGEEKDEEALVVVMMEAAICILGRGRNGDGKPLSLSNTS